MKNEEFFEEKFFPRKEKGKSPKDDYILCTVTNCAFVISITREI